MQEYQDGTFGAIKPSKELLKEIIDKEGEIEKTLAIHFGTKEELQGKKTSGEVLMEINGKLDKIIKHFNIYDSIGHTGQV